MNPVLCRSTAIRLCTVLLLAGWNGTGWGEDLEGRRAASLQRPHGSEPQASVPDARNAPASTASTPDKKPAANPIQQLNEIPLAQLRVLLKGFPGDWRKDAEAAASAAEPPREKALPPDARLLPLVPPTRLQKGGMPLREALAKRRSVREFSKDILSAEDLSFLLWATQGVTGVERDASGAVVQQYRAAPSAGGRYPLETYLAIQRVEGLPAGIYRYVPGAHQLQLVREDPGIGEALAQACYGAAAVRDAALVFLWSATPRRTEWKYAYLAHRMIAMEAGHVCQNLYLAAESGGLGVCALLSYHQPALDAFLGVDGEEEFVVYLACVGRPTGTDK